MTTEAGAQRFDADGPVTARLVLGPGHTRVVAGHGTQVAVDVRPMAPSRQADVDAAARVRVRFAAGRLDVVAGKPGRLGLFGRPGNVEVLVELPQDSDLTCESAYGDVEAEGPLSGCTIASSTGNVHVSEAAAVALRTSHGDITLGRATGQADLDTSSGTVRAGDLAAGGTIGSSAGDIVVQRCGATLRARTAYGRIRVDEAVRGSLSLDTSYGSIDVGIAHGTAAYLDVASQHGRVRNELTLTADRPEAAETLTLHARTGYGDITIRRP